MAKRRAGNARKRSKPTPKRKAARKSAPKRAGARKPAAKAAKKPAPKPKKAAPKKAVPRKTSAKAPKKVARLDRERRRLEETVPTPPSSLNMNRKGSAARTGRAEMAEHNHDHANLTPSIASGDVDVNVEDAYFTGDEAPGGDNSTPDQDIVDDIGKALGVQYDDAEELKGSDKVKERDTHRWELDPASAEDYKDRNKPKS